ncbi:MAG: tetratricopeptide repeat protein [Planctomycetota bacterium]
MGSCQQALGWLEASLDSFRAAAAHFEKLADERPGRFGAHFGTALHNAATVLASLGRHDEALATQRRCVESLRWLAKELPGDVSQLDLAMALSSLAIRLRAGGEHREALSEGEQAVAIYKRLEGEHPLVAGSQLARALVNLGAILSDLGREHEAIENTREAASIYQRLSSDLSCEQELATCQLSLSYDLAEQGRHGEALEAARAAAATCKSANRYLAQALEPVLAASLGSIGNRLAELERPVESLSALEQSSSVLQSLARRQPGRFDAELARTVAQQGIVLGVVGRHREAEQRVRSGLKGLRQLADPDEAATGLEALATELTAHGRHEEALDTFHAALDLRRGKAAGGDVEQILNLLRILHMASELMQDSGRTADALPLIRETVDCARRLASEGLGEYQLFLAHHLNQLGLHLRELGRHRESLPPIGEAIAIYRAQRASLDGKKIQPFVLAFDASARSHAELGELHEACRHAEQALDLVAPYFDRAPEEFRKTTRMATRHYVKLCRLLDREPSSAGLALVKQALLRESA